ncbi:MAG: hypothetical protein IPN53_09180 [Comamonadaceae bacterium]|nr:hypothetical protein [Comamonadaceae bacterium]
MSRDSPCFTTRFHAQADQRLFVLYLPGAELTLHASVHGADGAERQMLFESLLCLGPDDVLILDRGYPAAWLVAYLTEHYIRFCMRCEKSSGGWAEVRTFERSDQVDATVTLNKPNQWDCEDYGCSGAAPRVRLRYAQWKLWEMATNLPDSQVPTAAFGELYQSAGVLRAFKRLSIAANSERLRADAAWLMVDVAKVLADNLAFVCRASGAGFRTSSVHVTAPTPHHVCSACCRVWCWGWAVW